MKTKMRLALLSLNLAFAFTVHAGEISVGADRARMLSLGNGWRSDAQAKAGSCVQPGDTITDGQIGTVSLSLDNDESATASKLGLDIGGRARIGVINYSLSSQFNHESMSRGFSLAYNYAAELSRSKRINHTTEHPVTPRPGFDTVIRDGTLWKDSCGDEVVYMVDEGAMLLVNIRFDFTSKEEKSKFETHVGVSGPLFSANAGVDIENGEYNRNSKMHINLLQIGGDPARLGGVFCPIEAEANGQPVDESCLSNSNHVVSCSFGDIKSCLEAIKKAVAYGNGQSENGFLGQVRDFNHYVTQKLYTQPWSELGGGLFPRIPSLEETIDIKTNRQKLSQIFEENYGNWVYSNRLNRGLGVRLGPNEKEAMLILEAKFKRNMTLLADAIGSCYDFPSQCKTSLANALPAIDYATSKYVNEESINAQTVPEVYSQICDQGLVRTSHDPLRATITLMNDIAFKTLLHGETGTELQKLQDDWKKGDVCLQAQTILEKMKSLNLKDSGLSDLSPVALLKNLEALDVSHNQIEDISAISSLRNLKTLDLSSNLIKDVSPLIAMPGLRELTLQRNPITNVQALGTMTQLTYLDLSQNSRDVQCPLPLNVCQTSLLSSLTSFKLVRNQLDGRLGHQAIQLNDGRVVFNGGILPTGDQILYNYIFQIGLWENPETRQIPSSASRVYHTVTKLNDGRILVAGGWFAARSALDTFELYTPDFKFIRSGKMKTRRAGHTATVLPDGKILLAGGWSGADSSAGDQVSSSFEIFDPAVSESTTVGELRVPRVYHTATLLANSANPQIVFIGGYVKDESISSVEVYDLTTGKTKLLRNAWMKDPRGMHTANLLPNGKILVAGGFSRNSEAVSTTEIYDPANQTFDLGAPMKKARGGQASINLENGMILITGGREKLNLNFWKDTATQDCERLAEVYDPVLERFNSVSDLNFPRAHHTMIALQDQRVLVVGGIGTDESPRTSEIFEYSALIDSKRFLKRFEGVFPQP